MRASPIQWACIESGEIEGSQRSCRRLPFCIQVYVPELAQVWCLPSYELCMTHAIVSKNGRPRMSGMKVGADDIAPCLLTVHNYSMHCSIGASSTSAGIMLHPQRNMRTDKMRMHLCLIQCQGLKGACHEVGQIHACNALSRATGMHEGIAMAFPVMHCCIKASTVTQMHG